MLTCLFCRRSHPYGTTLCSQCGRSLLPRRNTSPLPPLAEVETSKRRSRSEAEEKGSSPPERGEGELPSRKPALRIVAVRMTVLSSRRMYSFRAIKPIVLGRPDVQQDFYPDLDLTPEDGVAAGVSRAHARLVFEHGQCSVEDLGSDNGTFVNGFRMTPHGPYRLRSGDQLQLGTLAIEVELHDKPPAPIKLVRA